MNIESGIKRILNFFLILSCLGLQSLHTGEAPLQIKQDILFDIERHRPIPIQIYRPILEAPPVPLVIINHGYGIKNTEYSFLAQSLCEKGHFVICIQHDLPEDPELPRTGNLFEKRKPLWENGVKSILFVLSRLEEIQSELHSEKTILIGHSNGGDISMLFTSTYPELVEKVISLDSLRMPFPTKDNIPILSLRANDTKADEGVIPAAGATITIIKLENAKHIDMYDSGPEEVRKEIISYVKSFL